MRLKQNKGKRCLELWIYGHAIPLYAGNAASKPTHRRPVETGENDALRDVWSKWIVGYKELVEIRFHDEADESGPCGGYLPKRLRNLF